MYEPFAARDKIATKTGNKYQKELVMQSPRDPTTWYPLSEREEREKEKEANVTKVVVKGHHRWKALPEPVDVSVP